MKTISELYSSALNSLNKTPKFKKMLNKRAKLYGGTDLYEASYKYSNLRDFFRTFRHCKRIFETAYKPSAKIYFFGKPNIMPNNRIIFIGIIMADIKKLNNVNEITAIGDFRRYFNTYYEQVGGKQYLMMHPQK